MKYFGVKLHNLVTLAVFMLTSAAPHDNSQPVMEFLEAHKEQLIEVLGDKAYNGELLQVVAKEELGIVLTAPQKANQEKVGTKEEQALLCPVETGRRES